MKFSVLILLLFSSLFLNAQKVHGFALDHTNKTMYTIIEPAKNISYDSYGCSFMFGDKMRYYNAHQQITRFNDGGIILDYQTKHQKISLIMDKFEQIESILYSSSVLTIIFTSDMNIIREWFEGYTKEGYKLI